jgi:hypothetical protein
VTDAHKTTIVHAPPSAPIDRTLHPLIAQLAAGNIDPTTIGKMMDLQERHEKREAEKAFNVAMLALKGEMPSIIARDATVSYGEGKSATHYTHATLAGAMEAVTPHLSRHGFSLAWVTSNATSAVRVTARLTHVAGHHEETSLEAPPDTKGGKQGAMAIASAVTMLQRYTALLLLGIATKDMKEPTAEVEKTGGDGVDVDRNLAAVAAVRKAGLDLDALCQELGRRPEAWTALDRERVRDRLPKKRAPRENADGSVDVDPPKDA